MPFILYAVDRGLMEAVGVELKLGCLNGKGKRIPKGHAQKFATIALRLRAPDPQPFASSSTASDVVIEDLDGHFSGCTPKSFRAALPFTYDSNLFIRRHHAGIIRVTYVRTRDLRSRTRFSTSATADKEGQGLLSGYRRERLFDDG